MAIHGELEAFWETGTEGVYWSVIDPSLPGYDGLWNLNDGDHLRVLDADDTVLWEGVIALEYEQNWQPYDDDDAEYGQQAVHGYWVHGLQQEVDPETWASLFFLRQRAVLDLGPNQHPRQHPFDGPANEIESRLRTLDETAQLSLYRETLYPWLYFYSNGDHYSLLKEWGFALDEIATVIGATDEQIKNFSGKKFMSVSDVLIPFNWPTFVRLALLFGVHGAMKWRFPRVEDGIAWLNTGSPSPKTLLLQGDILQVRNLLTVQ